MSRISRREFVFAGGLAALGMTAPGWSAAADRQGALADTPQVDCANDRFPALAIRDDDVSRYPDGKPAGFRGFADPCVRRDPISKELWLAYSWPHMEHLGGPARNMALGVETHLAVSSDDGNSWHRTKVLWPRTPARFFDPRKRLARDGFISHEVPNILPCAIDGKPAWIGARLDYFLGRQGNYKDRDNLSFCLRVMVAPTPAALADAPYVTLGHDRSSPECDVKVNVCRLSLDFPSIFIPNEPALFFAEGRLYLAFVVMAFKRQSPDFAKSFIAVLSTEPRGALHSCQWRYHGKLAGHREARELGAESLSQIEFALSRDGKLLAFMSLHSWDAAAAREGGGDAFWGILNRGCAVVEVAGLDRPQLARRNDGSLAARVFLYSSTQSDHGPGATAYDPTSATGVLFTLRDLAPGRSLAWSLHATGLHP